ncbi:MAG: glycine C-acetyltransferase [Nitrospinae bacterium]|nr:glycine C-acetyltransferase [Nitrospinota bacterium]
MFSAALEKWLLEKIGAKKKDGSYKTERVIAGPQGVEISLAGPAGHALNFCSNNYLGLSNHPKIKEAASRALESYGFGMSSVRFICGTQDLHKELEDAASRFLLTEDTILYSSCFDANGGLFENFLGPRDAIISASLNHASIIDGARLSKARRLVYRYDDAANLEARLREAEDSEIKVVATDGVFSMEGELAPLAEVAGLCEQYGALLVVDDSHAAGFIGENGRGTAEYSGVHEKVDLFTGTFGKALGGASGGYISGKREFIEWFRNASRPYLFSNSMPPPVAAGAIEALEIVSGPEGADRRRQCMENARYFREEMKSRGFKIKDGIHPIVPIMLGDARVAGGMAESLLDEGIYAAGFSYPVVPEWTARIRVQLSAAHHKEHIDRAIAAFEKTGRKFGAI